MSEGPSADIQIDGARLRETLEELGAIGAHPEGGVSRLAFSDADLAGRTWLAGRVEAAGLEHRVDPAGNLWVRRPGRDPAAPPILFGSHIDTVPRGGRYDGALGSLGGLELLFTLAERGIETRHPLELVVWADEEGVTFGRGLFGSRAATRGPAADELRLEDSGGVSLARWLRRYGQDPDRLPEARVEPRRAAAYFELHIEQGPFLERSGAEIGIVEGIVGIERFDVVIEGETNHAGTTLMAERRDALYAAALLTQAVREEVMARPGRQVGNVGWIRAEPGAANVVPGRVRLPIELRDLEPAVVADVIGRIRGRAATIARVTGTSVAVEQIMAEAPALTDPGLREMVGRAAGSLGCSTLRLPSGAGHDAQNVARHGVPSAMIFVPSRGGISHAPAEWTSWEDCARGVEVLYRAVLACDRE